MEVRYQVPYFWPYLGGISPQTKALYMVGTSNQSVPEMAIDWCDMVYLTPFPCHM